jgi:hypothetical protein
MILAVIFSIIFSYYFSYYYFSLAFSLWRRTKENAITGMIDRNENASSHRDQGIH